MQGAPPPCLAEVTPSASSSIVLPVAEKTGRMSRSVRVAERQSRKYEQGDYVGGSGFALLLRQGKHRRGPFVAHAVEAFADSWSAPSNCSGVKLFGHHRASATNPARLRDAKYLACVQSSPSRVFICDESEGDIEIDYGLADEMVIYPGSRHLCQLDVRLAAPSEGARGGSEWRAWGRLYPRA